MSRETKLLIMNQLLKAIKVLNENKIIHGDIKPLNILLNQTLSELAIVDYGTAKIGECMT